MVKISACSLARVDTKVAAQYILKVEYDPVSLQTILQVTQRKDEPIPIGFSISGNVAKGTILAVL